MAMGETELTNGSTYTIGMDGDVLAVEFNYSGPATMTPAEWDAFVAAGERALGRPAPASTPLEDRLLGAIEAADEHAEKGWSLGVEAEDLAAAKGKAEGLRAALAMVREQGAMVPRAALSEALDLLDEAIGHIENGVSECAEPRRDLARLRALLDPTPKEPGHADD